MQPFVDQKIGMFIAQLEQDDMKLLGELMQAGKVTAVIDRRYALERSGEGDGVSRSGPRARQSRSERSIGRQTHMADRGEI